LGNGQTSVAAGRRAPSVMAVIHYRDDETAMRNADLARRYGCAGVFLIEMDGRDWKVDPVCLAIKSAWPDLLVGANRLSAMPWEAVATDAALGLDASWVDNPGASSAGPGPYADRVEVALEAARATNPDFRFFGSVAFKTQPREDDPGAAALVAASRGWIATTSGPATGVPPEPAKLAAMRASVGDAPLAVASGIDPDNVADLGGYVDWILVSTGVSRDFHEFDPERLSLLVGRAAPGAQ